MVVCGLHSQFCVFVPARPYLARLLNKEYSYESETVHALFLMCYTNLVQSFFANKFWI